MFPAPLVSWNFPHNVILPSTIPETNQMAPIVNPNKISLPYIEVILMNKESNRRGRKVKGWVSMHIT
jgi:hypothetical protein